MVLNRAHRLLGGKTRVILAWAFAIALVMTANGPPRFFGAMICLAGALLRVWASGHLHKNEQVAVWGPYAWVRNPLYLGTYLMALGCAAAAGAWVLFAVSSVAFAVVYHAVILEEEGWLLHVLGQPYADYAAAVPRFSPVRSLMTGPLRRPAQLAIAMRETPMGFDRDLARKHRADEALWTFCAMMAGIWLVAYFKG